MFQSAGADTEQRAREIGGQSLAADEDLQTLGAPPARVEEQPPRRRRRLHDRRRARSRAARQPPPVARVVARRKDDRAARRQRQPDLESRDVEGERRHRDEAVIRCEPRLPPHRVEEVDERPMRDLDAFRSARGARGVDHVGELRRDRWPRRLSAAATTVVRAGLVVEHDGRRRRGEDRRRGDRGGRAWRSPPPVLNPRSSAGSRSMGNAGSSGTYAPPARETASAASTSATDRSRHTATSDSGPTPDAATSDARRPERSFSAS